MKRLRYVVYGLLVAMLLAVVGVGVLGWQQGYRAYAVQTGSMAPTYPTGTLVLAAPVDEVPDIGTVITFRTQGGLVTHRVEGTGPDGVYTQGDANPAPDAWTVKPSNIVGEVTRGFSGAGFVLVFFQQPTGIPSLVLLALSVMFAWALFFPAAPQDPDARPHSHRRTRPALG
jgi:signal peptidase I